MPAEPLGSVGTPCLRRMSSRPNSPPTVHVVKEPMMPAASSSATTSEPLLRGPGTALVKPAGAAAPLGLGLTAQAPRAGGAFRAPFPHRARLGRSNELLGVSRRAVSLHVLLLLTAAACGGTLDAGWNEPRGRLPVDERNPIILCNDGATDNWQGEYAVLFASTGGPSLAGIVINAGWPWTDLDENMTGWQEMVNAARDSGLKGIPDPLASNGPSLARPDDGNIDSTEPNRSEGARFIVETSQQLSMPNRPVVVVTGGGMTDVADAYLMDHALPERVVVVSALGTTKTNGAAMGLPNGQLDTWADVIVAQKFRYVQVSAYSYDANADISSSQLSQLPTNEFTSWIASKQPKLENAMDQVGVQVVAIPAIVTGVIQVEQSGEDSEGIPLLSGAPNGPAQVVTAIDSALGTERLWQMLLDPATFAIK
jgi:hypothetical protein